MIQAAVSRAGAGDVICIDDGTYVERVLFSSSGSAAGPITLKPTNECDIHFCTPPVKVMPPSGHNAMNLNGQSFIVIEGMEIDGGIFGIVNSGLSSHTIVRNNLVHDTEASGIQLNDGDYRTIESNIVHDCAKIWSGSGSGISIYEPTAIDGASGVHNLIDRNISYNNANPPGGTDGEGIIFDDGKHSQGDNVPYTPMTLIVNNLIHDNGGGGVEVNVSLNVSVINNTAYNDRLLSNSFTWRGDCDDQQSSNVTWANNICWLTNAAAANSTAVLETLSSKDSGIVWTNNFVYDGVDGEVSWNVNGHLFPAQWVSQNRIGVNPMLLQPGSDFRPAAWSPLIGAGTALYNAPTIDINGTPRPPNSVDVGAYQH
jgi:hypothetical protein